MIVETRKTPQGTEYWDAKEQRVRFVPTGNTPPFEVTANPVSMIMGVDLASRKELTTLDSETQFEDMTTKELRLYAAELEIDIPDDVKKKSDIIKLLTDAQ